MLKAIVFDYNGVLIDDLKLHGDAYVRAAEDLNIPLTPEMVWPHVSTTPEEKRTLLFKDISDETWQTIRSLKDKYYFEIAETVNLITPNVGEVLRSLSPIYALALVSNTSRRYFERCFPRDLAAYFKETLFSEEMDTPKPSPDPLFKILKRMTITPDESCYVGDSTSDVQMAKSAGVEMFGVTTGHHSGEELRGAGADWVVGNLREFADRVKAIENP